MRDVETALSYRHELITKVDFEQRAVDSTRLGLAPLHVQLSFAPGYAQEDIQTYLLRYILPDLRSLPSIADQMSLSEEAEASFQLSGNPQQGFTALVPGWGIIRHPAQLYESISSLLIFFTLFILWQRRRHRMRDGEIFGWFLVVLFSLRFFYEFMKENQVPFEDQMKLNMGQWLSIPLVLAGLALLVHVYRPRGSVVKDGQ